jgi:hypothetical protein
VALPCYSTFVLNAASKREYGVDQGTADPLILLRSSVHSHPAVSLWDTGAEAIFVATHFVDKHGLQSQLRPTQQRVKFADGSVKPARGELTIPLVIHTHGRPFECQVRAIVADLQERFDIVLGTPFCSAHLPRPDFKTMDLLLPTRLRNGEVSWQRALRAPARHALGDELDNGSLGLCEVGLEQMDRLRHAGLLDLDTACLVHIGAAVRAVTQPPLSDKDRALAEQCTALRAKFLAEFAAVFPDKLPKVDPKAGAAGSAEQSGTAAGVVHRIELKPGAVPYSRPLRRMSTQELDELKKQLTEYLEDGRIRPSESPWGTNVIFAKKKDGGLRFCVDYRGLNDLTVRNSYALPHMDQLFDRLAGARYFSKIDLRTGFYQIPLAEEDRAKTAFRTRYGHFEWTVLPMGLTNSPATFQHLMNHTFREFLDRCVLVFLDDIVVYSRTLDDHVRDVRAVLQRMQEVGLYGKASKCELFMDEIEFLGHRVGRDGLRVLEDKVAAVRDWPQPRNAGEVRSFLGLAGYYRRFVQGFSKLAAPLHDLTKTTDGSPAFRWLPQHQQAFDELKQALQQTPVLALPDPDRQFVVYTDASDFATGAVLMQDHGRGLQPIAFLSHKMSDAESRYPTHDKEMLAIINMLGEWRTYLHGRQPFTIRICTDHNSLQYFMTQPSLSQRQARWVNLLVDFDFKVEYVRGLTNVVADALSRRPDHLPPEGSAPILPSQGMLRERFAQHLTDAALSQPTLASMGAGTLARQTLDTFTATGLATVTKAELLTLPLLAPTTPATLAAAAHASRRRKATASTAPLTDEQRRAHTREATTSHEPASDRPQPDHRTGAIHMPSQQCVAFTKQGTACKRRTCRGHHCADHMRLLQRLAIRQSGIPGAGLGLFMAKGKGAKPFRRGDRIVLYSGDWAHLLPGDAGDHLGGPYFLQITRTLAVDAARTNTALGRWANAPHGAEDAQGRPLRPNAQLVLDRRSRQGSLRASATIQPGDEILVSYGRTYWRYHGGGAQANELELTAALATLAGQVLDDDTDEPVGTSKLLDAMRSAASADDAYQRVLGAPPGDGTGKPLTVRDGLLYHGDRVVVPNDAVLRTRLLAEAHDAGSAGHSGVAATVDRLGSRVYWAGMHSDVHDYVVSCDSCQRNKVEQRRTAGLLRPLPVPDEPGYSIAMDYVFGLPRTADGYTGYLSITCRLSGYTQAAFCSDEVNGEQSAQLVFEHWVAHYGLPATIVSDRDPRFTGHFWRELWRLLDTQLLMSTAGHPQTDGKSENRQRTANTQLRHYVDFEQSDWDSKLRRAIFAINHTRHASTKLTPFEVMFRRAPRLPLDIALHPPAKRSAGAAEVPAATNWMQRHNYVWAAAKANLENAQADQKKFADRHRRDESFAVGDLVMLSTRDLTLAGDRSHLHRAAKLKGRFIGPYPVTEVVGPNAYKLALPPQLRGVHPTQNISKLKRHTESPPEFSSRPLPHARPRPELSDSAGNEYTVERILDKRGRRGRPEYLVKWAGYHDSESTWEPVAHLRNAAELVAAYDQQQQFGLHSLASSAYSIAG